MLSRDEKFQIAKDLMRAGVSKDLLDSQAIADIRKMAGTAKWSYKPGKKFWNWLMDTEYTAKSGIAPIIWILVGAAMVSAGIFIVLGILFMVAS